jgi:4-phosphopantoate--beta-alanine ligase
MAEIPGDHPRHDSLVTRHRIEEGVETGITSKQGLIAQGRGEAFDYLLGERTIESADIAARVAASHLLSARHPVLSVNGNVAALCPAEMVDLANTVGADLEINLFGRTDERVRAIAEHLREHGAHEVKGLTGDARIPNLSHERAKVDSDGIYDADVVLVPLEDGDRAEALGEMGTVEIVIDLNPLSRSAQVATVPVVDNVIRAVPNIASHARGLRESETDLDAVISKFDPKTTLLDAERVIRSPTDDSS